jgi:hypothetical protein
MNILAVIFSGFQRVRARVSARSFWLCLFVGLVVSGCGSRSDSADKLPTTGTVVHGPFEIVASIRRISTGTFPNQGGNPFATVAVSDFQLRWRGKNVSAPSGTQKFWTILRLVGAPRPSVLLVTSGFVLVSEDDSGKLQMTPLSCESNTLAESQWLDADGGQPGPVALYGIGEVNDLESGTTLAGGRWLRLGSRCVIDVNTLVVHRVTPWVPIVPGVPITSISREGDTARAFSPGKTKYVLAAAGIDYGTADQRHAYGFLVVDIATGVATEFRVNRQRYRFAGADDLTPAWMDHNFRWQRDANGREQFVPREQFKPWKWRSEMKKDLQLDIRRIDGKFVETVRRLAATEPGARVASRNPRGLPGTMITLQGCTLEVSSPEEPDPVFSESIISIYPPSGTPGNTRSGCEAALRRLATLIDAELATGKHDSLLQLDVR